MHVVILVNWTTYAYYMNVMRVIHKVVQRGTKPWIRYFFEKTLN
jgi:hypothetical protein